MLRPKQQRFVEEYMLDLNATQAAARAGYSRHTAKVQGSHLLSVPAIKVAIAERQARAAATAELTEAWVITGIKETYAKAVAAEQFNAASRCLDLAARHLGMLHDKVEVTLPVEERENRLARLLSEAHGRLN